MRGFYTKYLLYSIFPKIARGFVKFLAFHKLFIKTTRKAVIRQPLSTSLADLDLSVLSLEGFNAVADQDQNLAICAPALIICNHVQFVKHLLIYSD